MIGISLTMIELAAAQMHFTNQHSKHFQSSGQETMNIVCVEKKSLQRIFPILDMVQTRRGKCVQLEFLFIVTTKPCRNLSS